MASIIVADEQEGRRNLLAGTLEREDYSVTRTGTLRQCEGTALATMPDVVLIDGEWKTGDAIDAASRLSSDPEFALKCRIVILSSNFGEEYLKQTNAYRIFNPFKLNHFRNFQEDPRNFQIDIFTRL